MSTSSTPHEPPAAALAALTATQTLITHTSSLLSSLSAHYTSLSASLAARHETLASSLLDLDSSTAASLASLAALADRDSSLPGRELSAAALVRSRKLAALAEVNNPDAKPPTDLPGFLKHYCKRMDSAGLWRLVVSRRKHPAPLRKDIAEAVGEAVDPPRLVIDAVADFLIHQSGEGDAVPVLSGDRYWGPRMLLWALFDEEGRKAGAVSAGIKERAVGVAEMLKGMVEEKEGEGGMVAGPNGQMFLQLVVAFGLSDRFEQEFLKKLMLEHAWRKEMPKLAVGLGFGQKMSDIINELVNMGKDIEAVYFSHESGLVEQFPPVPLIESYLQSSKRSAQNISKNGNHSIEAVEKSCNVESNALRSIIKCVETLNLGKEFSLGNIKKRLVDLEKEKADRRKAAAVNKNKRQRSFASGPTSHRAKAVRTSNTPYASFPRHSPASHQIQSIHHSYNYPSQVAFDSPVSSLDANHSRSSIVMPKRYYAVEDMHVSRAGVPYPGPSVGYNGYDYAAPHAALAQPAFPHRE